VATAKRTSTGRAASAKTGAASAVAKDKTLTVESDTPTTVDPVTDVSGAMERAEAETDAEDARQRAAAKAETASAEAEATGTTKVVETPTGSTVPEGQPAKITEGVYHPDAAVEEPVIARDLTDAPTPTVEAAPEVAVAAPAGELADPTADETPARDLAALRALADTSGLDPATPYTGLAAPAPVKVLPPVRDAANWSRPEDETAVGRVLVDGFRVQVNGSYRFARKGDLITAPVDVIDSGARRGVLHKEG
jgi:hypothetical protein